MSGPSVGIHRHRWRHYKTAAGRCPVREFISAQTNYDAAAILTEMIIVRREGVSAARAIVRPIYEVRVDGLDLTFRVLFAPVGHWKRVFLTLDAFAKKSQKTPLDDIRTAKQRLHDWNSRGLVRRIRDR
jgi:hypothetical protein